MPLTDSLRAIERWLQKQVARIQMQAQLAQARQREGAAGASQTAE